MVDINSYGQGVKNRVSRKNTFTILTGIVTGCFSAIPRVSGLILTILTGIVTGNAILHLQLTPPFKGV